MFTLNTSFPLGFSMNHFLEPICEEDQVRMFFFLTIFEIYKMKDETIIIIIIIVFVHGKEIDKQRHQSILKRGSSPNRKQSSCIPWAIYFTK